MVPFTSFSLQLSTPKEHRNLSVIYCSKIIQSDVRKRTYVDQMIDKRDKEKERIQNCIRSWLRNLLKFDSRSKWQSSLMKKGQRTKTEFITLIILVLKTLGNNQHNFRLAKKFWNCYSQRHFFNFTIKRYWC